ncbi:MAG TPA: hypothetical protein VE954_02790, partial [Oligoflexus sp.]|uniref:hypothetical protein n=1 Tax=Oligoflexus sp. TaxID=1971216 RepID=UPI002D5CA951
MTVRFIMLLSLTLVGACVTGSRAYDSNQPAAAWDAECQPENLQGMSSWVVLTCTMTNRSDQTLAFHAIDLVTSEKEAWRQPDPEELGVLKRDLQARKTSKNLPLMLNGSDRLEGFVAQMLVVSGLWLTQSLKEPGQLPDKTEKTMDVKPDGNVRQAFILYKDSLIAPSFVTLISADGR